ncbi:hypothetical protein K450DRAFT_253022 [Umbelopsis ramanniana AG]|uniref:Uncharacterized protein n=1 Tax=Umbelopsis ramanniana AG TaxID=1314678 RepID=A0AAD5E5K0_UMBRA|nr:uncharacterized protein K450DRAFT_253022 [Umbelopsis ramanniana AG]KAI8577267.1 hypothetical protein K450DRAFT_253022 [Umbelopsis ramanniana AG]
MTYRYAPLHGHICICLACLPLTLVFMLWLLCKNSAESLNIIPMLQNHHPKSVIKHDTCSSSLRNILTLSPRSIPHFIFAELFISLRLR